MRRPCFLPERRVVVIQLLASIALIAIDGERNGRPLVLCWDNAFGPLAPKSTEALL